MKNNLSLLLSTISLLSLIACDKVERKEELELNYENKNITVDFSNDLTSANVSDGNKNPTLFEEKISGLENYLHDFSYNNIYFDQGGLRFGSSSDNGKLIFNLTYEVIKVECLVSAYTKISDSYYGADANSKVYVNELASDTLKTKENEVVWENLAFEVEPSKHLVIKNTYPTNNKDIENKKYSRFTIKNVTFTLKNVPN